ncbi:MAG TPA: acyltransferase [Bacteroidia bacterium]|nr:acyltransferase [Bacteroidia bacterium]
MKVYFPNLNSLRFFAALLVIIHHIEQYKEILGLPNYFHQPNIQLMSKIGVTLFFALSGFLITYLLLVEQKDNGNINVKSFYIRRILRIWPLYYLIIFLAFFIFPNINLMHLPGHDSSHFLIKFIFFVFMMPNVIHALGAGLAFGTQTWSIGAEEQFYLIWPWLIKLFKNKLLIVISVILSYACLRYLFDLLFYKHIIFAYLYRIWYLFPIDNMAFGALFAVIYFNNYKKLLSIFYSKLVQFLVWIIVLTLLLSGKSLGYFHHQIYSLLFGILILNLATNSNSIINFKINFIDYLGKISYGLYMYHSIFIVVSIKLLEYYKLTSNIYIYILSFALNIGISILSYEYFEKRFITKKSNFSAILSGENAKI